MEGRQNGYKKTEIGVLPIDWNIGNIGDLHDENIENSFIDGDWIEARYITDHGIRLIQTGNIGIGKFVDKDSKKYISEDSFKELKCKEVKAGDILICRLADPTGRSCIIPDMNEKMITAVDVVILRINKRKHCKEFFNFYFNTEGNLKNISLFEQGTTRKRISRRNLGIVKVPMPTKKEQQKIAKILSTLDKNIEKTQEAIEKYKRIKSGLMDDLLTGKIRIKDGKWIKETEFKEVEGVGRIPKDWEVVSIEDIKDKRDKYSYTGGPFGSNLKSEHYTKEGIRIIQLQNIGDGQFIDEYKLYTSIEKANELLSCNIYPDDIIISKMAEPLARACKIPNKEKRYLMASDGIRLNVDKKTYNSEFILTKINSSEFRKEAIRKGTGTTRTRIGLTELKKIYFSTPNFEEQNLIMEVLSKQDRLIEKEQQYLEKLKKLKSGLMEDLLTGKVRVKVEK